MARTETYSHIEINDTPEGVNSALRNIAEDLRMVAEEPSVPVLTVAPEKPFRGQLVFADGVNWDPGSGPGVYVFDTVWVKL